LRDVACRSKLGRAHAFGRGDQEVKTFTIVVGLVLEGGKLLMLKRAQGRRHAAGKWEPVSGFLREHEATECAVVREVFEETGLRTAIVRTGAAFEVEDDGANWIIKPYLLARLCRSPVTIEREHEAFIWATLEEIEELDCVGGMDADFRALGLVKPCPRLRQAA
jgi:8-oxo-dGTP diphosphatase